MTQGRGVFTKEFVRYEEVPEIEVAKAIESINELRNKITESYS
ncbi:translation elongation factor EF-G [Clostridium beijerinckii]|nr:translation elongation factor EF-G [Clostridium beijerinckii]